MKRSRVETVAAVEPDRHDRVVPMIEGELDRDGIGIAISRTDVVERRGVDVRPFGETAAGVP